MSQEKNHLGMARVLSAQFGVAVEASQAERFLAALNEVAFQAYTKGLSTGMAQASAQAGHLSVVPSESQVRH